MVNGSVFLISLSDFSSVVYRNAIHLFFTGSTRSASTDHVVSVYLRSNDNNSLGKGLANRREKRGFNYLLQYCNLRGNGEESSES